MWQGDGFFNTFINENEIPLQKNLPLTLSPPGIILLLKLCKLYFHPSCQ